MSKWLDEFESYYGKRDEFVKSATWETWRNVWSIAWNAAENASTTPELEAITSENHDTRSRPEQLAEPVQPSDELFEMLETIVSDIDEIKKMQRRLAG